MTQGHLIELLGWCALGLNVWGNMALTKRQRYGWPVRLACNAVWIAYSSLTGVWPLLANHALFAGINILGWYRWTEDKDGTRSR